MFFCNLIKHKVRCAFEVPTQPRGFVVYVRPRADVTSIVQHATESVPPATPATARSAHDEALLIARVSALENADGDGIPRQMASTRKHATRYGFERTKEIEHKGELSVFSCACKKTKTHTRDCWNLGWWATAMSYEGGTRDKHISRTVSHLRGAAFLRIRSQHITHKSRTTNDRPRI